MPGFPHKSRSPTAPFPLAGFNRLGIDTMVPFHFYNYVAKEPIAIVTVNNTQNSSTSVQFKNTAKVRAVEEADGAYPSVTISPNPAGDEAVIRFNNITPGAYKLVIVDEQGRMVRQKSLQTDGQKPEQINLSGLLPGMYVLTQLDVHDRILYREKLIKAGD